MKLPTERQTRRWRNRKGVSPKEFSLFQYEDLHRLAADAGETKSPIVKDTLALISGFAHKPEVYMERIHGARLYLLGKLARLRQQEPNDFLPLPPRDLTSGELFIGWIIRSPGDPRPIRPLSLSLTEVLCGVGFLGAQGSGKSTSMLYLAHQVMGMGFTVWIIEVKREASVLLRLHPDMLVFDVPGNFKYDPLKPPPGADPRLWLQTLTDVVHQATPMKAETSETFFLECCQLRQRDDSASFLDLPGWLEKRIEESPSADRGRLRTVRRTVNGIIEKLGPMLDCREGYSWNTLTKRNCIFRLTGLSNDMLTLTANLLQLPLAFSGARSAERDTLRTVLFFDEAKMLFGKEQFTRRTRGVPFAKQLWTQMRGLGVGLTYADNVSTDLAPFPVLNSAAVFYFHQGGAAGIREAFQVTGAQERHKVHFYGLRPKGQAFLKKSGHPFPILVQTVNFPKSKHIPEDELETLMAPRLAALRYCPRRAGWTPAIGGAEVPAEPSAETAQVASSADTGTASLPGEWASFLTHVAAHPEAKVSELYESYGVSHRKAHRLRKELEENGLVETRTERSGERGRPGICLKPTEKGMRFLDEQRERRNSSP